MLTLVGARGEKLGDKAGTFPWGLEGAEFATPGNDFHGLEKIRELILGPARNNLDHEPGKT